jgi:site-specific DNA-methyltransferase (adenine-specific)
MELFYDRDGITIWHGDCADIIPLVPPDTVGLLLTDPPYGIGYTAPDCARGLAAASRTGGEAVLGDETPFDPTSCLAYRRVGLWGGDRYSDRLPVGGWLVWDKTGGGKARTFMADAEMMWHNMGASVDVFHHLWLGAFRDSEPRMRGVHPTQKPVALMRWIVERWTEPGDLVFDPYMGSGPIAQACHELGRRYIGVEIIEEYCQVAVNRLAQQVLNL